MKIHPHNILKTWFAMFLIFIICLVRIPIMVAASSDIFLSRQFLLIDRNSQEQAITSLVKKIAVSSGLKHIPEVTFYDYDWRTMASNTALPETSKNTSGTISVNMKAITDSAEAAARGLSIEQTIVLCIAHEVRHSYQAQHAYDDSDYGRACLNSFNNYVSYTDTTEGYYQNFIEKDAEEWGTAYMQSYFASSSPTVTTTLEKTEDPRQTTPDTNEITKEDKSEETKAPSLDMHSENYYDKKALAEEKYQESFFEKVSEGKAKDNTLITLKTYIEKAVDSNIKMQADEYIAYKEMVSSNRTAQPMAMLNVIIDAIIPFKNTLLMILFIAEAAVAIYIMTHAWLYNLLFVKKMIILDDGCELYVTRLAWR